MVVGYHNYNQSADPYYHALENAKFGRKAYRKLQIPGLTKEKLKDEEFGMRYYLYIKL